MFREINQKVFCGCGCLLQSRTLILRSWQNPNVQKKVEHRTAPEPAPEPLRLEPRADVPFGGLHISRCFRAGSLPLLPSTSTLSVKLVHLQGNVFLTRTSFKLHRIWSRRNGRSTGERRGNVFLTRTSLAPLCLEPEWVHEERTCPKLGDGEGEMEEH